MAILESQIEDVFQRFHSELLEPELKLMSRQQRFPNRLRTDLIFKDRNGKTLVLELKKGAITRQDIGQYVEYHSQFEDPKDVRIVIAAPTIPPNFKAIFEHYGFEYLEFSITAVEKLYEKINNSPTSDFTNNKEFEAREIITLPLKKKIIDGNVAFKVVYNDKNWRNVCSPDIAAYNFKHRTWCGIQSKFEDNCQNPIWNRKIKEGYAPCHDCVAVRHFAFYPGHNHSNRDKPEPRRMLGAKLGKFAIFTSIEPGAPESERFIFGIGQIDRIDTINNQGYERLQCNPASFMALIFHRYYKFWDYYVNPNTDRIAWNTGLYRYIGDKIIINILTDLSQDVKLDAYWRNNANQFLTQL